MAFYPLERLINLKDGYRQTFVVNHKELMLVQVAGERFVFQASCPHKHWPLMAGKIVGKTIECAKHGAQFSMETGLIATDDCSVDCGGLLVWPVVYEGTQIGINVPAGE
ncbi:Toluene 1,2-dioxygenase system ferredoxin subunit [BD1-7 clade bacterium]|uniref:Toluene 1,2-dioxygenase system ferredoxin subunit n=1 Tax=BD1-7 clade bacterium TaxID=2029982 RepID=A0A5S9QKB7_9GAMM|nr:Toluene 1,2-dioxygenase system ferredoxin subunit [BD1-7 clade bacterium]